MVDFKKLDENFRFLILEVQKQVDQTFTYLNSPQTDLQNKIIEKDDYIDNLKNQVENECFAKITSSSNSRLKQKEINIIRSMQTIAVNLERIADFCVNIVRQVHYLSSYAFMHKFSYASMIEKISSSLEEILPALNQSELSGALTICKSENELDGMYKEHFDRIMNDLKSIKDDPGDYITMLFIVRYLERIGDALLNIGEAIIFSIIGEKIKINQFQALQQNLSKSGYQGSFYDFDFSLIWGTRSGCRIGKVQNKDNLPEKFQNSIFKEGSKQKILQEKQNLEKWMHIYPGLVPRIFSYHQEKDQDQASLLLELIPGCTLDEAILTADLETLHNAYFILIETLRDIWEATQKNSACPVNFVQQIKERMSTVQQVHPEIFRTKQQINGSNILSTFELLEQGAKLEQDLPSPFSVFIHGDLNLNNIVYNHTEQKIHFIDLHRSKYFDYVQDISVFLISNFRLPVQAKEIKNRIHWMIFNFLDFTLQYAREKGDKTFEARLTLAIARSLFTSTRFELEVEFSKEMFLRSQYLLERMVNHRGTPWEEFRFPKEILFYHPKANQF